MLRKLILPIIAGAMLLFAVLHVVRAQQTPPKTAPPAEPARSPYGHTLSGSGIVESRSENIAVGSPLAGTVAAVPVKVGQKVAAGAELFRLDDRHLKAELKLRHANLAAAGAQLAKLEAMPRPEEIPAAEARAREGEAKMQEADASLVLADDQFDRARRLAERNAVAEEEVVRARQQREVARKQRDWAQQQYDRARSDLDLLRAGAWDPDKMIAQAAVAQMQAQLDQTQTELDRLTVRASIAGEVLQVNVRSGEYVPTPPVQPLVVIGDTAVLHVRADIDENDIPRFRPDLPAIARPRGAPTAALPLRFVRVEPFVVPKKSLTGMNTERVDTRVLQVIYAIDGSPPNVFVGQQMDVFLEVTGDQ